MLRVRPIRLRLKRVGLVSDEHASTQAANQNCTVGQDGTTTCLIPGAVRPDSVEPKGWSYGKKVAAVGAIGVGLLVLAAYAVKDRTPGRAYAAYERKRFQRRYA